MIFDGASAYMMSDCTDICMCVETFMSKYGKVTLCFF